MSCKENFSKPLYVISKHDLLFCTCIFYSFQIAPPSVPLDEPHITESDLTKRAECVLENAKKLDCDSFVRPSDIVEGNPKLNLAFMCHLFNSHPSLVFDENEVIDIEETREEKTLRNWINSLGVKPQVHHLFSDLSDGIALAQLFEQVRNTA